ncbi:MAG: galactose mutarotase [Chitinophagaceae bacterium]|jgi:aldose 1-epimerase|nr:galactose mutarotase [Chitinophagaceae bacterium]
MGQKGTFCCKTSEGDEIYLFSLRNNKNTEVLISNYGCIINAIKFQTSKEEIIDIVLGFDSMKDYIDENYLKKYPYFGAAIGRYANRIGGASFTIDSVRYDVSMNNKNFQLHGGWKGFDRKIWEMISFDEERHFIEFQYLSKDGEEGFPGNALVNLRFELNDLNELSYTYTATTDQSTVINLTHHSYFNLNNGVGNILDHELMINSSQILEQDKDRVSTGNLIEVENSAFDFSRQSPISKKMDHSNGIDHSYLIDSQEDENLSLAAQVYSPNSHLLLEVLTSEPIVHFYAGQGIPPVMGKRGEQYGDYSGLCLETHIHPNAINIPHFPDTILRPGETYYSKTAYRISELVEK